MTYKINHYVELEAESIDEAVALAYKNHRKHNPGELTMSLDWVDTEDHAESYGELCYEIVGICEGCGRGVVIGRDPERKWHPEWPWSYSYQGNEHNPDLMCYECAESPLKQLARCADDEESEE